MFDNEFDRIEQERVERAWQRVRPTFETGEIEFLNAMAALVVIGATTKSRLAAMDAEEKLSSIGMSYILEIARAAVERATLREGGKAE